MRLEDLVALGRVTRTQGNAGAVRLLPFFSPPQRFEELIGDELLAIREEGGPELPATASDPIPLHFTDFSYHKQFIIVWFAEIPDMNAAEKLRGCVLYVPPDRLWPTEQGEYFTHELEGFDIVDEISGERIGTAKAIEEGAAHDFIRVAAPGREFLVPFVRAIVKQIDPDQRRMIVSLPEGLRDL
jgi:16S rRNA processing protein RimM